MSFINQFPNQATILSTDQLLLQRGEDYFNVFGADLLSGTFVEGTAAAVAAIRTAGTLSQGAYYYINDSYLWIEAIETDQVSISGLFLARNGDYQSAGDYTGITIANGFTVNTTSTNLGVWHGALAPAAGDVVIYNNLHWLNLLGAVGTAPSGDAVNWEAVSNQIDLGPNLDETLTEIRTFGYIFEIDEVRYDLADDTVLSRVDRRGNIVRFDTENSLQNPIDVFQWGNDNVYGNKVEANSLVTCHNNRQDVQYNTFRNCTVTVAMETNDFNNNVLMNVDTVVYSALAADVTDKIVEDNPFTTIAQFVANTNNFALPEGTNYHMSTDVSRNLTGMTGGREGRRITIHNNGTTNLVILQESASSTAANRFVVDATGGASLTLTDGQSADFVYSTDNSRWNLITLFW